MIRSIAIAVSVLLSGCVRESEGDAAARRYEIVSRHGSLDEQCDAARDVATGYLRDGNEDAYATANARADNVCLSARLAEYP